MPESFGARLRRQRERQEISLVSIAEQTKISVSLLEALERDDVSHWPAGIFRRAFIRAYAQIIGLDPAVIVTEFLELYPDPIEVEAPVAALAAEAAGAGAGPPPTRLRYLIDATMAFLARARPAVAQPRPSVLESVASAAAADRDPAPPPRRPEPDLSAAAHLCTQLGRAYDTREATPLLEGACRILDAVGLIVWVSDPQGTELKPALAHGYSDRVLAQMPRVRREGDNATAAAFRSTQTRIVNGTDRASGAVVVPLMTAVGCVGVLAVELQRGGEQRESVRALATIFAAHLAMLIGTPRLARAVNA